MEYSFEKLEVYQHARELVKELYQITNAFPKDEALNLTSQIRRAAVSICANIAEGSGKEDFPDKRKFLNIAYGSALEIISEITIACDLDLLAKDEYDKLRKDLERLTFGIYRLRNSFGHKDHYQTQHQSKRAT